MSDPVIDHSKLYTYGDYLQWSDDQRWEIIAGIPYNMTPAPLRYHQDIVLNIATVIKSYLKDKPCKVFIAPFDVRFPESRQLEAEILTVVQPDISVICDQSKLDEKGCNGSPDWIIEVLSPATAKKDRFVKFHTYQHFKVKEYWLVSPEYKTVEAFILKKNKKFGSPMTYSEDALVSCAVLEGLTIDLKEIFSE